MECLLPYLCMVTVPHIMVGLERMLGYRGVGLARFHCTQNYHRLPTDPGGIDCFHLIFPLLICTSRTT